MPYAYCPVCATAFERKIPSGEDRERLVCPGCHYIHYINPKPTVKGIVMRDGQMLMVKRAEAPGIGGWDFPGGYLEWDEHPEVGLVRECHEETGITVKIDRLLNVYHKVWKWDRVESSILNLVYVCKWIEGEASAVQPKEISHVAWVEPGKAPDWVAYGHWDQAMTDLKPLLPSINSGIA